MAIRTEQELGEVARPFLQPHNLQRGVLMAALATFAWSTTGIFIDELITRYHMTPLEVSVWRGLLVTPGLALYIALREPSSFRLSRREIPYYVLYGLIGIAIFNIVWSNSVQINRAAVATALIFSAPVFVAIGARFLFKERLHLAQGGAIAVNLIGCALVAGVYDPTTLVKDPAGLLVGLGSGLTFAASTLFGKGAARMGQRSSSTILFYIFFFATIAMLAIGLAVEGWEIFLIPLDSWGWLLLVGLSLGPTLAGYAFFTSSLRYLPAAAASLFSTLEPPITALLALIFLGQVMNGLQWLGTSMIVGGVFVMQAITFNWRKV